MTTSKEILLSVRFTQTFNATHMALLFDPMSEVKPRTDKPILLAAVIVLQMNSFIISPEVEGPVMCIPNICFQLVFNPRNKTTVK